MNPWRYRCPEGHASITIGRDRFKCSACRKAGETATFPKDDLVDLLDDTDGTA